MEELTDEVLLAKREQASPVGKKKIAPSQKKKNPGEGAGKKKKDDNDSNKN